MGIVFHGFFPLASLWEDDHVVEKKKKNRVFKKNFMTAQIFSVSFLLIEISIAN